MKTLFLLRHAKSSWKNPSLTDFERPLNARGVNAAGQIGNYLRRKRLTPDLILCSPATRARETITLVLQAAKLRVELRFDERLYLATVETLLEVIAQIDAEPKQAMMVGHNPGMEELVKALTGADERMATGALARISLDIKAWSELPKLKQGRLEWLVRPKELED